MTPTYKAPQAQGTWRARAGSRLTFLARQHSGLMSLPLPSSSLGGGEIAVELAQATGKWGGCTEFINGWVVMSTHTPPSCPFLVAPMVKQQPRPGPSPDHGSQYFELASLQSQWPWLQNFSDWISCKIINMVSTLSSYEANCMCLTSLVRIPSIHVVAIFMSCP